MTSDTKPNPTLDFMTVVPVSFQLCGWLPAWWRGAAGGDDVLELIGADLMTQVSPLRATTTALSAYSPDLGVGTLPGPKPVTEAAVAAGEAVILHAGPGQPSTVLIPGVGLLPAGVPRPLDLDLDQAAAEFAQAVVRAEHELRSTGAAVCSDVPAMTVRPLPPGADGQRKGLLVRAVRVWTAVGSVPAAQRSAALQDVVRCSARAALTAYREAPVLTSDRTRRFA